MRIKHKAIGDVDVLALSGEFDSGCARQFDAALEKLIGEYRTRIVIDLSGLSYMDSSGLTRLIHAHARLRPLGGEHVLAGPSSVVLTTIKTAGLDRLLRIFPDADEAQKYFADPERAQHADMEGVPVDEAHIGRIELELGLAGKPEESGTGKLLTTYEDGLMVRYPIDAQNAAIAASDLDVGQRLWVRFRQPIFAPDREFSMEAEIAFAHDDGDAAKYRLKFTKIDERDRELMRDFAGAQDAIRKYGNPPA
ncbi:MAG: anti-sigma factor antagonist [Planctomycetota bacterium]|jgi:anti-anti-sigma factor